MDHRADDRAGLREEVAPPGAPHETDPGASTGLAPRADDPAPWRLDRLLLLTLVLAALTLIAVTPQLIVPFKTGVPWYESGAMFPRAALALMAAGAAAEWWVRRRKTLKTDSDELDSSSADIGLAARVGLVFVLYAFAVPLLGFAVSSAAFLFGAGLVAGVPWRRSAVLAVLLAAAMWFAFAMLLRVPFGRPWLF